MILRGSIFLLLATLCLAQPPRSWKQLADDAISHGDYAKAEEYYAKWTEADPTDAVSLYNLACCRSILKNPDAAMDALHQAAAAGWSDSVHTADDPDLESLRTREDFTKLLREIARNARTRFGGYPIYTCQQQRLGQYLVVLPETYDPAAKYPLVILLQNYGSNPENFANVASLINTNDFIYAVPEAPYAVLDASGRSFSHLREREDFSEDENSAPFTADWIISVADDVMKRYPIAGNRFWIIGFSQGGAVAHITAALHPDRVAGYAAVGGYIVKNAIHEEQLAAEKSAGVRALIVHGQQDDIVSMDEGIYAYNMLRLANIPVSLETPDIGHEFAPEVGLKVNEWLRQNIKP